MLNKIYLILTYMFASKKIHNSTKMTTAVVTTSEKNIKKLSNIWRPIQYEDAILPV